jgi:transcriptional regulator with XRE-family HTH domain
MENLTDINIYKDDIDNAKNYFKSNNIDNSFINKISSLTGLSNMTINRFKTYHVSKPSEIKITKAIYLINSEPEKVKEMIENNKSAFKNESNKNFKEKMQIDADELSNKIRSYMYQNKLTLKDLSRITNVSVPSLSRILAKAPKKKIVKSVIISILKVVDSNIPYSSDIIMENKLDLPKDNTVKHTPIKIDKKDDIKIITLILKRNMYDKLKTISDKHNMTPVEFIELFINDVE